MSAGYESQLSAEEEAELVRLMKLKGSYGAVGDAVFAALTARDKARLVKAMRFAAKSEDDD